jgi:aminoglycoside phosphotransferase (APT) family kinase protein
MVLQLSEAIVVKIARVDTTQYTSMEYIQKYKPSIPAPIPHGLVEMIQQQRNLRYCLIFMSYIPGQDLEGVWSQLESNERKTISIQLGMIISDLRHLPVSENQAFGGVEGEGCKDARRDVRTFHQITTLDGFEKAIYFKPRSNSPYYCKYLDNACAKASSIDRVFTHGDLRKANIMVQKQLDKWMIVGIVDWEFSGIYPGYWEVIKATSLLTPWTKSDWYNYLQTYALPGYHSEWCRDRLLNQQIDS